MKTNPLMLTCLFPVTCSRKRPDFGKIWMKCAVSLFPIPRTVTSDKWGPGRESSRTISRMKQEYYWNIMTYFARMPVLVPHCRTRKAKPAPSQRSRGARRPDPVKDEASALCLALGAIVLSPSLALNPVGGGQVGRFGGRRLGEIAQVVAQAIQGGKCPGSCGRV